MTYEQITDIARENGMKTSIVTDGVFSENEFIAVNLKRFTTAMFLLNESTGCYEYVDTYNAINDKRYKRTPSIFKAD